MPAAIYDCVAERNADFDRTITWYLYDGVNLQNLSGYVARMDIKENYNATAKLSLTTANSRITLGGTLGTIALHISAADVNTYLPAGKYVYDLLLVSGAGQQYRLIEGVFDVRERVTA